MKYTQALQNIKKGSFNPVYIVNSGEVFFREELFYSLQNRFFTEGTNSYSFNAGDAKHQDIISEITAISLFSTQKIVRVIQGFEFLENNLEWFEEFLSQFETTPGSGDILFWHKRQGQFPGTGG